MNEESILDKKQSMSITLKASIIEAVKKEAKRKEKSASAIIESALKKQNFIKNSTNGNS